MDQKRDVHKDVADKKPLYVTCTVCKKSIFIQQMMGGVRMTCNSICAKVRSSMLSKERYKKTHPMKTNTCFTCDRSFLGNIKYCSKLCYPKVGSTWFKIKRFEKLKDFESIKQALPYIVSLSKPGKMETFGYSTSALDCKQGGKLNLVEGSVCHKCYARKGRYVYHTVKECLNQRMDKIKNEPYWVDAMIYILNHKRIKKERNPLTIFRWHGNDLYS